MTRDEIMKLEGRELDAAVAEKVMGWDTSKIAWRPFYISSWQPSENIADAWQVVEKIPNIQIAHIAEYGYWRVAPDYHEPTMFVIADTPELAICRAALLAILE